MIGPTSGLKSHIQRIAEATSGPMLYFYRMLPPQFDADVTFGGQIRLDGYDLSADTLAAGETLTFRPYWRIEQPPTANYSMFIHLYRADDETRQPIAQWDGAPTTPQRLTVTWDDPDELYIGADAVLMHSRKTSAELRHMGPYEVVFALPSAPSQTVMPARPPQPATTTPPPTSTANTPPGVSTPVTQPQTSAPPATPLPPTQRPPTPTQPNSTTSDNAARVPPAARGVGTTPSRPDCSQMRGLEKSECERRDTVRDDLPAGVTTTQPKK